MSAVTARLSHYAKSWTSNVDKHSVAGEPMVRLCNYTDVYKNAAITGELAFMTATATVDQIERFRLRVGDVIITKDSETADDIGIPAFVEYESPDLICGYHLAMIRADSEVSDARFLFWVMSSRFVLEQWTTLASGVTRVGLRSADIGRVEIPAHPIAIQRAIADFLDRETAQIDALIAKQEQLIATLRERRESVVRRRLRSDVVVPQMRRDQSSIRSELPTGWRVVQLRRVAQIRNGSDYQAIEVESGGYPVYGSGGVFRRASRYLHDGPSVLFGRKGTIDKPLFVDGKFWTVDTMFFSVPGPSIEPRFLHYVATTVRYDFYSTSTAVPSMTQSDLLGLDIPLPPLEEQRRIVAELDAQTARIDTLIDKAERFIALSKERRAALITAAVTGELEIPADAAPSQEAAPAQNTAPSQETAPTQKTAPEAGPAHETAVA